jgi:hypothetical protein
MAAQIDNKITQKVKETISRMNKNEMKCGTVILDPEQTEPVKLMNTTIARILPHVAAFKSGKTEYMCDGGRVILLVNYFEPATDLTTDPLPDNGSVSDSTIIQQPQQFIIVGVILAPTLHPEFALTQSPIQTILDVVSGPINSINGALTVEFPIDEKVGQSYKNPVQLGVRLIPVAAAFKETDQVVQRFYEYMRQLEIIQDEPEEDMGALADAAGFEW